MPRPYPQPPSNHVSAVFMGGAILAVLLALLMPTAVFAGDRDSYGRSAYYYNGDARYSGGALGYYPNLDDSYHARYDRPAYRTANRYGYTRSYERDYNGRDYDCGCGRGSYTRVYNWKDEHEYRQTRRQQSYYSSRYNHDSY